MHPFQMSSLLSSLKLLQGRWHGDLIRPGRPENSQRETPYECAADQPACPPAARALLSLRDSLHGGNEQGSAGALAGETSRVRQLDDTSLLARSFRKNNILLKLNY
jgi:hypothetical protein